MDNKELEEILKTSFGITKFGNEVDSESDYFKRIQELLAQRIQFFIRTDMDRLLQILYQIDIPQSDSDQAFDLGEIKKISLKLAEKIINRQLQKIDYAREFYKRDK